MDERRKPVIDGAERVEGFIGDLGGIDPSREAISAAYRIDETAAVTARLRGARLDNETRNRIDRRARRLVREARKRRLASGGLDAFLGEYALSSQEGVVLMCLAEGLSGTGPKAGGPRYLHRFAVERSLSVNTTAIGGNATLLSLGEES